MKRLSLILVALLLSGCSRKPLPVLGEVPAFRLTDHLGRNFYSSTLGGHVWIADFVFTNCEGPCPRMSSHMGRLQRRTDRDVKLISFTVDPRRDTPKVLGEYARKFGNDSSRWLLLTGDVPTLNMLDHDAFKLGSVGGEIEHSTRFALVDKRGRIRGYYGMTDDPQERLARDAKRLEKETS